MIERAAARRLSKEDHKFLLTILDKAEEEANTEIQIDGDNKTEASLTIKRINRIRMAVIDLDKK